MDPSVRYRETSLLLGSWIPWSITVILMTTRFWSRIARRSLGPDDWCALAGWIGYSSCVCMLTVLIHHDAFDHIANIPFTRLGYIQKVLLVDQCFAMAALCLTKVSVGLMLARILKGTMEQWRQKFIYANIVLYVLITITVIGSSFAQCDPPRALWHPELVIQGLASCPRVKLHVHLGMWHAAFGAWMDFAVALLPITFVYKLEKSLGKKIGICCLLGLGVVAGTCAVITVQQFHNSFAATDPTYDVYALCLWAGLELPFVLIGGCIPPSKPVFEQLIYGTPIRKALSVNVSSETSRNSGVQAGWFSRLSSRKNSEKDIMATESSTNSSLNEISEEGKDNTITVSTSYSVQHDQNTSESPAMQFTPQV